MHAFQLVLIYITIIFSEIGYSGLVEMLPGPFAFLAAGLHANNHGFS